MSAVARGIGIVPKADLELDRLLSEVAPKGQSATYAASKLRITLYPPYSEPEVYENCKVLSGLMPELEFKGIRLFDEYGIESREAVHVTSTTLPYKIEALTDVIH